MVAHSLEEQAAQRSSALKEQLALVEHAKLEYYGLLQSLESKYATVKRVNLALETRIRDLTFELESARAKQQRSSLKGQRDRTQSSASLTGSP